MTMRTPLTAIATLALGLVGTGVQAQTASSVTVYGIADAGVESSTAGNGNNFRVISGGLNGSRIGFRGTEDLGGGLSALFRIEQGFTIDDGQLGQGGRAWGREASVGLRSNTLGTLQLGRLPTPYFIAQSGVDAFNWMGSGGLTAITRSAAASRQLLPHVINARQDNALGYVSPKFGDVEVRAVASLGEGSAALGRGYSLSARYTSKTVDLLVAQISQRGANNRNGQANALVIGGSAAIGSARIHAGYTAEKNTCTTCTGALARVAGVTATGASEFRLMNLGVRMPFGAFTGIAQVVQVNDRSTYAVNPGNRDATWLAVGAEYAFSRRTVLYGALGTVNNRNGSQYALGSGTAQQPAGYVAAGNPRSTTATLGIRHSF